jgi:hypothetical protein
MPSATNIRNQLRALATAHDGDPAGKVAERASELATKVVDLEGEITRLKSEVNRLKRA